MIDTLRVIELSNTPGLLTSPQYENPYTEGAYAIPVVPVKTLITQHTMSVVTSKYKPLLQTVRDQNQNLITIKHAYSNMVEYMPTDLLDKEFETKINLETPHAYKKLKEQTINSSELQFIKLKHKETV